MTRDFIDDNFDIDQHHPGQYADPDTPFSQEMLRHALMWMEGMPEFEDLCHAVRDELSAQRSEIKAQEVTP